MELHKLAEVLNNTKRNNQFQVTEWTHTDDKWLLGELMNSVASICDLAEGYRNKSIIGFAEPQERGHRTVPEALMLIVTEVAEAYDAWQNGDKYEFLIELADIMIRVLDTAADLDLHKKLEIAICEKDKKNRERGFRHGGKTA